MRKLVWLAEGRSPYNDYLFSEVARVYALQVIYIRRQQHTHPYSFTGAHYTITYVDQGLARLVRVLRAADCVVVAGWYYWKFILLMFAIPRRCACAFWTDTPRTDFSFTARDLLRHLVMRYVFDRFDQVWSTGRPGKEALAVLGCPPGKVRSLPFILNVHKPEQTNNTFITESEALRRTHAKDPDTVVFVCAGQLIARKRVGDSIAALAGMQNPRSILWIAGSGPLEGSLRQQVQKAGLEERVAFLGWKQEEEMDRVLYAADVFVHAAGYDPFPTVVLDAMIWGLPIIGSGCCGSVADRVLHGVNGCVFAAGRIDQLTASMDMLSDPKVRKKMGVAARTTACQYDETLALTRLKELCKDEN